MLQRMVFYDIPAPPDFVFTLCKTTLVSNVAYGLDVICYEFWLRETLVYTFTIQNLLCLRRRYR